MWEWTEETSFYGRNSSTQYREVRGGCLNDNAATHPACFRHGSDHVSNTSSAKGFRVVLYIK